MKKEDIVKIRVAAIILKDGKVLLIKHRKGSRSYWLLPGGGLEYGECIHDCLKRELKEELNLEIKVGDFLFLNESIPPDRHRHVLNLYFMAEIISGNIVLGKEKILDGFGFFGAEEIDKLTIYPNTKEELKKILQNKYEFINPYLGNLWE
jgi:ADP-ribose pyrophosphatase YjhB (NUDIX family)